jgi:hypothetical protein
VGINIHGNHYGMEPRGWGEGVVGFKSDTGIVLFMDENLCNQLVDG